MGWGSLSDAERQAADAVRRDMEDTAEIISIDEPEATVALGAPEAPPDAPEDSQIDEEWLRPPDWSIEHDQAGAHVELEQSKATDDADEFWSPIAEDQASERATVVLGDFDAWTPDAGVEAEIPVEADPDYSDEIIVTDPFREMVGDDATDSEIAYPYAAEDEVQQDDFWSPVSEEAPTGLPEEEPDAEWLTEAPAAVADDAVIQAETVVLSDHEPLWPSDDVPATDDAPVESEVDQASAATFWHAINDDRVFAEEIPDLMASAPVEEPAIPRDAAEADELAEVTVAADHDLDAAIPVEAFWCPEELLVTDALTEAVDDTATAFEAEPTMTRDEVQDLRDRSRSAELGAALLDLAFSVETGPDAGDTDAEAGIAVLDENAEAQFALEMFETFALECADHVEALNLAAMQLDRNPQAVDPVREVKRALHTLKGAAAAAEFDTISERCHRLEDSLLTMERLDGTVATPFVEDLFTAIEDIERMVEARRVELFGTGDDAPVDETSRSRQSLRVDLARIDALLNTVGELVVNRAGLEQRLERLALTIEELSLTANRLQRSGYLIERERYADDPIARFIHGELMPAGIFSVDGGREFPADWDELEMDRYTEFDRLIRQLGEVGADVGTAVNEIAQLRGDLDTISTRQRRLTTNLQDELMDVRMVPISSMAPRLYRVVRRVAQSRDKLVNLVLEGGDTPFDKMLLDALSEPLLHLLRNAVDHGIETTAERRRLGKPETGTVKIRAYRDGNEAVIDILDDGAGIDQAGVLQRARELGMQVDADISGREALQFIFLPGFSTRLTADEVSGRGVGPDIVEQTITQYNGRVAVDSIPGQGSIFSLRLPVMLAVTQAFLVVAGGARYAIPIANIESVADREDQPLTLIGETVVVERGDTAIPVIDLSARFGRADVPLIEREAGWVMIADVDGQSWALVVDELHGQQEVVVRPLGRFLRATPGMMGATILGNGDVALIVDVPQLFSDRTRVADPGEMIQDELPALPETPAVQQVDRRNVALVVDDSLSVRRVVGRTLERHGWVSLLARDGVEALELLEDGPVDVVITDIEMPRMDGFDLLTSVRARRNLRDLPVVVLTSRSGEKHRGRALELGANGYLVKPFQEQDLVEMVTQSSRLAAVGVV